MTEVETHANSTDFRRSSEGTSWAPKTVGITAGFSKDDLWHNFETILAHRPPGTSVTVDLTNDLRLLPASLLMALGFCAFRSISDTNSGTGVRNHRNGQLRRGGARRGRLASSTGRSTPSGALPTSGSAWTAARTSAPPPRLDLTAMFQLRGWAQGVSEWKRTGRSDGLMEHVNAVLGLGPVLKLREPDAQ
ncbi:MAG: hypothetical protein RL199_592 [Pseudomonadota bacterium]|jgi:hypothetical protein